MKVKVGDVVRLLEGAVKEGIPSRLVGKIARVEAVGPNAIIIEIDYERWFVSEENVELVKLDLDKAIGDEV